MREEEQQLAGSRYGTGEWAVAAALGDRPQSAARWPEGRSAEIRVAGVRGPGSRGSGGSGGGRGGDPGAGGRIPRLGVLSPPQCLAGGGR